MLNEFLVSLKIWSYFFIMISSQVAFRLLILRRKVVPEVVKNQFGNKPKVLSFQYLKWVKVFKNGSSKICYLVHSWIPWPKCSSSLFFIYIYTHFSIHIFIFVFVTRLIYKQELDWYSDFLHGFSMLFNVKIFLCVSNLFISFTVHKVVT